MGVDVVLKARLREGVIDAETFETLRSAFREKWPKDEFMDFGDHFYPDLGFDEYEPVQTIEVKTLWRYYGKGYERGPWPDIREMGDWLATMLGETAEVRYGGDTADEWEFLTPWPDARAENDPWWAEHETRPYHEFMNRGRRG